MKLMICLDEKNGMMFAKRRQSKDSVLNEKVLEIVGGGRLLMNAYSSKLFGEGANFVVEENPFANGENSDFCFWEGKVESLDSVEELYVFLWNRHYPADVFFKLDIEKEGFALASTEEFAGSSHEKITLNVYKR